MSERLKFKELYLPNEFGVPYFSTFSAIQPRGPPNFVALVDRKRLSHGGVFRHCSLATNHETMLFPSRLARQRKHNFSVVSNQLSSDCGVHSSSYVDESSTVEEHCLTSSIDVFTENPSCQPHVQNVKQELIMLSLPAIAGQAIEPLAQLMETAYIGRLGESMSTSGRRQNLKYKPCVISVGSVQLASAGVSMSIFNVISKLFNIPLLSVATSFVAEDISNIASRTSAAGEHCQRESGNGKPFAVINTHQQLSSVSMALVLAAAIGIFEALALSLGSGLFLSLLGISPASSRFVKFY
ncbi:hypothetical protein TEA_017598 [Camellia sinensis var. sinensis]|uniref:Uncharacterized protein n=1 Tax=Camellia sinensis var. sinensis TaxID=542762 RepID=A0A4S4D0J7_CAMSN|nr:hypothetical protein TEA_017598 [Camellia sinensis var. sinensis]